MAVAPYHLYLRSACGVSENCVYNDRQYTEESISDPEVVKFTSKVCYESKCILCSHLIIQGQLFNNFSVECSTKANLVMVFGEITTKAKLDFVKIVRDTLQYIGYDDEEHGSLSIKQYYVSIVLSVAIDYRTCQTLVAIHTQAPDIAQKVHEGKADEDIGAGDQVSRNIRVYFIRHDTLLGFDVWLCHSRDRGTYATVSNVSSQVKQENGRLSTRW